MTNLLLSHFSKGPLSEIRSTEQCSQVGDFESPYEKPKGLWVSVDGDDDWPAWCSSEMPEWMIDVARYRIYLTESPRVLLLSDLGLMTDFQAEFGRDCGRWGRTYIDWPTVASRYQGIIIAPYHWPLRTEMDWYYTWDCASGCIWDASAIARVEEFREAA